MQRRRYISLIIILCILYATATVAVAQRRRRGAPPPFATFSTQWTPQEQLVSLDPDFRTVSLKTSITTDRQFWAMEISCALSVPDVFETSADDQTMTWDASWNNGVGATPGDNRYDFIENSDGKYYVPGTLDEPDRINASITRVGAANSPVGFNGVAYTQTMFNLELTIVEGLTDVVEVGLNCDTVSLLDRNGESVGDEGSVVAFNSINNLTVRDGYRVSGAALRQASEDQEEVEVQCEHMATGNTYVIDTESELVLDRRGRVVSAILGVFSFENDLSGTNPLRDFGLYECIYISKLGGTEDTVYLNGRNYLNLQTPEYKLQPIVVPTGDTDNSGMITAADFVDITLNWDGAVTPYTSGDVNGDGLANQVDLAITAGNVGLSEADGGVLLDHVLYSVARDYNGDFPNNTLNMGGLVSGHVNQLSDTRAFWPQVSPDGSSVAFYMNGLVAIQQRRRVSYVEQKGLAVSPIDGFAANVIIEGDNFAPSWSPSGGQLAYICSWEGNLNGNQALYGFDSNNGNLCIANATGSGARTIIPSGELTTYAEVFPPAWYDENTILYAGNVDHPICPDQICYYNILKDKHGLVDIQGIDGGASNKANMPVIVRDDAMVAYLYYRHFTNSDTSQLRMGPVSYDSATDIWSATGLTDNPVGTSYQHEVVDGTTGGVHYYDVSPMRDVMFYEFGDYQFHNLLFNDAGSEYEWTLTDSHIVDGFIGYPMMDDTSTLIWDGYDELNATTDFHAYRATFDWLP